jgi:hypothetical protein
MWILTIKSDVIAGTLLAIISHSSPATISIPYSPFFLK